MPEGGVAIFAEREFPPAEFRRLAIDPVVRKDELEYFREIDLHETAGGTRPSQRSSSSHCRDRLRPPVVASMAADGLDDT